MSSTIKVIAKPVTTKVIILPRYNSLVDIEAVDVSISDAGGYYDSANVEGALAEIRQEYFAVQWQAQALSHLDSM